MTEVYVKAFPHPMVLEEDGRLSLRPLKLDPDSITIEGKASLVGPDGITKRKWTSLLQMLPKPAKGAAEPGTEANPLQVDGTPVPGGCRCLIFLISSLIFKRKVLPIPCSDWHRLVFWISSVVSPGCSL